MHINGFLVFCIRPVMLFYTFYLNGRLQISKRTFVSSLTAF